MRYPANTYMTIAGTALALGGAAYIHPLVQHFVEVFVVYDVELSAPMRFFVGALPYRWALPLAVLVAAALVRTRAPDDTRPGLVALSLGAMIAIGLPLACWLAMYLPIFHGSAAQ